MMAQADNDEDGINLPEWSLNEGSPFINATTYFMPANVANVETIM